MMRILRLLFPASLLCGPLAAQLAPDEPPPKHLRFLALGGLPERQGALPLAGGAPAEAIPPSPVSIRSGDSWLDFQLPLLAYTRVLSINGNTPALILRKNRLGGRKNWVTAKRPVAPLSLGVLYRDLKVAADPGASETAGAADWSDPELLLLKDDANSFPAGSARFVNLSGISMLVQIGDATLRPAPKIFTVPVGKALQKPLAEGETPIRIGYLNTQQEKIWIWSEEALMQKNHRLQAFTYATPGIDPRHPITLHVTLQPLPLIPEDP